MPIGPEAARLTVPVRTSHYKGAVMELRRMQEVAVNDGIHNYGDFTRFVSGAASKLAIFMSMSFTDMAIGKNGPISIKYSSPAGSRIHLHADMNDRFITLRQGVWGSPDRVVVVPYVEDMRSLLHKGDRTVNQIVHAYSKQENRYYMPLEAPKDLLILHRYAYLMKELIGSFLEARGEMR